MPNPKLEKAVRLGLQMAAGKTMDEAVQEMLECLGLVIDIGTSPAKAERPSIPAPVFAEDVPVEVAQPLDRLAPIGGSREPEAVVVYWTLQELQDKVLAGTPLDMEIQINDAGDKIKLFRHMAQDQGQGAAAGVQLGYKPQNPDPAIPYPKTSFWTTTETLDLPGAVAKMREAAVSMYKVRVMPQTRLVAAKPIRFSIGGDAG